MSSDIHSRLTQPAARTQFRTIQFSPFKKDKKILSHLP